MTLEEKLYEASGDWAVQNSCTHGPLMRESAEHIEALKKCLKAACDDWFGEDWAWSDEAEVLLGRDPKDRPEALKAKVRELEADFGRLTKEGHALAIENGKLRALAADSGGLRAAVEQVIKQQDARAVEYDKHSQKTGILAGSLLALQARAAMCRTIATELRAALASAQPAAEPECICPDGAPEPDDRCPTHGWVTPADEALLQPEPSSTPVGQAARCAHGKLPHEGCAYCKAFP